MSLKKKQEKSSLRLSCNLLLFGALTESVTLGITSFLCLMGLTHCSLVDFSTIVYWKSSFATLGVLGVIF